VILIKKFFLIIIILILLLGCSEAKEFLFGEDVYKITINSDRDVILADGVDSANFTILMYNDSNEKIKRTYTLYVNEKSYINKSRFSSTIAGKYTIYAKVDDVESNKIVLEVSNSAVKEIKIENLDKNVIIALNKKGVSQYSLENIGDIKKDDISSSYSTKRNNLDKKKIIKKDRMVRRGPIDNINNYKKNTLKRINENTKEYNFLEYDYNKSKYNIRSATKVYGDYDSKCLIFLEKNSNFSKNFSWDSIGKYFDLNIYGKMVNVFGEPTDIDSNAKVVILYMDLGDEYFGYFDPVDYSGGNEMEIIYMNSNLDNLGYSPNSEEMLSTLAHEFQHLINYGNRYIEGKQEMDIWIDEGLSMAAEHYVSGIPRDLYLDVFRNDRDELIRNGKPLCYFDIYDNGESYGLSYTFLEYCKNQYSGKEKLFKKIIEHEYPDYRSIVDIMKKDNSVFTDFETLLLNYRIANLVNLAGVYGYGNERNIFNFTKDNVIKQPTEKFIGYLAPGGTVYYYPGKDYFDLYTPNNNSENIKFIKISN